MRLIAAVSVALLVAGAAHAAWAVDRIMVRATSVLPDAVGAVLIEIGQPVSQTVEPGEKVEPLLQAYCGGSVSNRYIMAFAALNPGPALQPAQKRRDLLFPACARIQRNMEVAVQVGDDLDRLLQRELGATPESRLLVCQPDGPGGRPGACRTVTAREAVGQKIGRPDGRFEQLLPPPRTLVLPFRSRWTTIGLKEGITQNEATRRLVEAAKATDAGVDLLLVVNAPELDLLAPLANDDPDVVSSCAPDSPLPPDWPFNRTLVREALEAAVAYIQAKGKELGRSVIRIADTGVARLGEATGFPADFLAVNEQARHGDRTRDRTGFAGAHYGIDAENRGDVAPRQKDPHGGHGTQVANLALGGAALRTEYPMLAHLLGLNVARLFTDKFAEGAPKGVWVNAATLNSSLTFRPPLADIVNFSVGGPEPIPTLMDEMTRLFEHRQLVVIAAGNEGRDLGRSPTWPAAYASDPRIRSALLVVGAHGPTQESAHGPVAERARFSNFNRHYVDLLAPGCRMSPAFDEPGTLVGTSFAAPLVAFTAGLIRDFLYEPQSVDIRNRLWASTRWVSQKVADETGFGGILDIPAALRVFDDIIRLRGGSLVPGRWLEATPFEPCDDAEAVRPEWVLRVRVELQAENQPPRLYLLFRDMNGLVNEAPACTAASEDGPTFKLEGGEERRFRWREMEALIPAVDLARRRISDSPQPAAAPVAAAATPTPNLDKAQVARLQSALATRDSAVTVDGQLGPSTMAAIREFQRGRFEAPTGVLTPAQQRALLVAP